MKMFVEGAKFELVRVDEKGMVFRAENGEGITVGWDEWVTLEDYENYVDGGMTYFAKITEDQVKKEMA